LLGTKLADLPSLATLRKLRHLDLGNETRMTAIPASVCALDQVRELRIGNGTIKVVPDAIGGMRALEVLDMQSAKVSKLPASLATLPARREVNIRWTRVDAAKARALLPSRVTLVT
jgi:Leucine-rich repeat (LRR) protein